MSTLVLVLLQILLIIGLSRLLGLVFRWLNQPLVIGEIVAGICLGPSLLGLLAPATASALFPPQTIPYLNVLSQIGLIFFMFLIGLELNPKHLKGQIQRAVMISHMSIVTPFLLGALLSLLLYPLLSSSAVSFPAFALFLGSAMSITAFPVLARIITENNLQSSRLGTLALTCAAVDDVTAWCLLAVAIAITRTNSMLEALPTLVWAMLFIALMLTAGRWFLERLAKSYARSGSLSQFTLAGIYMGVVASAVITEFIGIHFIFGAFLMGVAMPKNAHLTRELAQKTEDFVLTFLLPVFFAYSGLRTEIGLLNQPFLWLLCGLVLLVAISGKFLGTFFAARFTGLSQRDAAALGWLMNTRGLTELIVLNIGLSLGVISPLMFTMLVIMALVTTFMTSPLLERTYAKAQIRQDLASETPEEEAPEGTYRILLPLANPRTQTHLLDLALAIAGRRTQSALVYPFTMLHLEEDYAFKSTPVEADRLLAEERRRLLDLIRQVPVNQQQGLVPLVRIGNDVTREINQIVEAKQIDLVLMGWHRSTFLRNQLGGRVGQTLKSARTDVAIFVNRQGGPYPRLLVPYVGTIHDDLALELALRMLLNDQAQALDLLRVNRPGDEPMELSNEVQQLLLQLADPVRDRIQNRSLSTNKPLEAIIDTSQSVDLTIAGTARAWGIERQTLGYYTDALAVECHSALLITRRYSQAKTRLAGLQQGSPQLSDNLTGLVP
jgi:Kef-type K+ transport system membrane component KefB/nucleotide-binding universal stress UspA family protein